jgi:hypothetical protein
MKQLETAFAQAHQRTESLQFVVQTIASRHNKLVKLVNSLESAILKL